MGDTNEIEVNKPSQEYLEKTNEEEVDSLTSENLISANEDGVNNPSPPEGKTNDENFFNSKPGAENKTIEIKTISSFEKMFGFAFTEASTIPKIVNLLHRPADPSSLATARILFGFLMMVDVLEERGFGEADLKWGEPTDCRFPLFDFLKPLPLHWMCILYLSMLISACGIMLGFNYKLSCFTYALPYWYLFLLDKTSWNNHSYMFGILAVLFMATDSHTLWSIDSWRGKIQNNKDVPLWNYAILRFQLFLLYFYAGLKKTDSDWINGYSMLNLSTHWVFYPFKFILNSEQIDIWVVHIFGFLIDLTMGFLIYFDKTRILSFYILSCFHLMNSQLFYIGMFPFVCLATMPLFCNASWPRKIGIIQNGRFKYLFVDDRVRNPKCIYPEDRKSGTQLPTKRQFLTIGALYIHVLMQLFLPYSHFITKGYNNWTNGLYGYSWDMMVHTWDTSRVTIKVLNKDTNETMFLDPEAWVQNSRWQRHADMIVQYSKCVKKNLEEIKNVKNAALYIDIWVSLNKRYHQRMFHPKVNILTANWSPFERVSWVMPLINESSTTREDLMKIEKDVMKWSNYSDVVFMADFPGFELENYVHKDLNNITLTVISGKLSVVVGNKTTSLSKNKNMKIPSATFHYLHTISNYPSAFMYTYYNTTKETNNEKENDQVPLIDSIIAKLDNAANAVGLLSRAVLSIFYSTPMTKRVKVEDTDD